MVDITAERVPPSALIEVMTRPRATLRRVLDLPPDRLAIPIALGATLSQILIEGDFDELARVVAKSSPPVGALIVFGASVLTVAIVIAALFVASHLMSVVGKLLGGTATPLAVKSALGWGSMPYVWALLWRIPFRVFWGTEVSAIVFSRNDASTLATQAANSWTFRSLGGAHEGLLIPVLLFAMLETVAAIWYVVVMCACLGEAHVFSGWRALGTIVFSVLVVVVVIAVAFAGVAIILT